MSGTDPPLFILNNAAGTNPPPLNPNCVAAPFKTPFVADDFADTPPSVPKNKSYAIPPSISPPIPPSIPPAKAPTGPPTAKPTAPISEERAKLPMALNAALPGDSPKTY